MGKKCRNTTFIFCRGCCRKPLPCNGFILHLYFAGASQALGPCCTNPIWLNGSKNAKKKLDNFLSLLVRWVSARKILECYGLLIFFGLEFFRDQPLATRISGQGKKIQWTPLKQIFSDMSLDLHQNRCQFLYRLQDDRRKKVVDQPI